KARWTACAKAARPGCSTPGLQANGRGSSCIWTALATARHPCSCCTPSTPTATTPPRSSAGRNLSTRRPQSKDPQAANSQSGPPGGSPARAVWFLLALMRRWHGRCTADSSGLSFRAAGRGCHAPDALHICDSTEALTALAAAGYGTAVLPLLPGAALPGLARVPLAGVQALSFGAY